MSRLFHPLLMLIATATDSRLARHVQYLTEELAILRARLPKEIHTTKEERTRLLKFGKPLGKDINKLIQIVKPDTFHRWVRQEKRGYKPCKPGRPRKQLMLRELVRRIARETGVGYTRILGELRRLGVTSATVFGPRGSCYKSIFRIIWGKWLDPGIGNCGRIGLFDD